jgi:hypothetical protein
MYRRDFNLPESYQGQTVILPFAGVESMFYGWLNAWHQIAGTYDGKTMRLYVDGKEIGTKSCEKYQETVYPVGIGYNAQYAQRRPEQ